MAKKNAVLMSNWLNKHNDDTEYTPANYTIDELSKLVEGTLVGVLDLPMNCECPVGQCGGKYPDPDEVPDKLLDQYLSPCPYCGVSPWGAEEEEPVEFENDCPQTENIEDFPTEDTAGKSDDPHKDIDSDLDDDEDPFAETEENVGENVGQIVGEKNPEMESEKVQENVGESDSEDLSEVSPSVGVVPCTHEMFNEYMNGVQENVDNFFRPLLGDKFRAVVLINVQPKND